MPQTNFPLFVRNGISFQDGLASIALRAFLGSFSTFRRNAAKAVVGSMLPRQHLARRGHSGTGFWKTEMEWFADHPLSSKDEPKRTWERAMSTSKTKSELHQAIALGDLFVAACASDEVSIVCRRSPSAAKYLSKRGYRFHPLSLPPYTQDEAGGRYFILPVLDQSMKASELMGLRDHGVPFSKGKEWNPCEVFEYLRDLGLAEGGYWSISWSGPGKFSVAWKAPSLGKVVS